MLDLQDFFHLPQVDALVAQLVADGAGLILVAGLDSPEWPTGDWLPGGRTAIFRILMRQMMAARPSTRTVIVAETRQAVRVPRKHTRQVEWALVASPDTYAHQIERATRRKPDVLMIDRLESADTAIAALQAAQNGLKVLTQLDTVFCGAEVAYHLLDLGVPRESLRHLTWIITVHRLATLCPHCKQPDAMAVSYLTELRRRYPQLAWDGPFFRAEGCPGCNHSGREGSVMAFDIFRAGTTPALPGEPSLLPMEEYLVRLALLGQVGWEDAVGFRAAQLRRTYRLLLHNRRALAESKAALERKLAQLEAAHLVLQQRTEALISLQDISQTLATASGVEDLAMRVCRHTCELCGADHALLYFLQPDSMVEIVAVTGWEADLLHRRLEMAAVMGAEGSVAVGAAPTPFTVAPPGVNLPPASHWLKAGLRVPLVAQHKVVGLMIIHTTQKTSFLPGEVAMLRAFAHQAAVALQRAGLIEALRDKIAQLEAAQVELVKKERLERELELARQVQQRLLPRVFPLMPGYAFAARCKPARQVGGDFYDVIVLDADRFGIVIADVSDKGMPAALFMALTRSLLLAEARRERSPCAVLTNVHRLLLELGQSNMFVTMFYGVVEVTTGRLTFVRAGHDRPLLLREGKALTLGGEGTLLGMLDMDQLHLSEEQIVLAPGDRLVLYTDGLIDALAADGRPFELSRLVVALQSYTGLPAEELCAAIFADLAAYQGTSEQYDDMTMLVVEVKSLAGNCSDGGPFHRRDAEDAEKVKGTSALSAPLCGEKPNPG